MKSLASRTAPVDTHPTTPSPDKAVAPGESDRRRGRRSKRIGLLSVSLGTAGLGGAWQTAAVAVSAPLGVSDGLFVVSGLVWLMLLAEYVRHGGARWSNLINDLRHPGQGFALAYVPIIGMLFTAHFSRFGLDVARWAYAVFAVVTAVIAARLLAHWLTGTLSSSPLHPGYLLPVSSGPFIASIAATTLGLPEVAEGAFAVGLLYWLAFGTVILSSLVANTLPVPARPTLAVFGIPPTVGGLAWMAAHPGPVDAVGHGFAGLVAFTILIIVFLLPHLRQQSFGTGFWIYSFPVAATTNFVIRWVHGAHVPASRPIAWAVLSTASLTFAALAVATAVHALTSRRRS
ncbi:hypothetical protein [Streptomyces sp. NPDC056291]|uniref:SLAC1 family transporter n=1 Tax=Streptomyces sp. NPDC056291 TaxID=3345772 RepID=UPI0035D76EEC